LSQGQGAEAQKPSSLSANGPPTGRLSARQWNDLLRPYKGGDLRRSLFQLLTTGALFFLLWYLMLRSIEVSYFLTLALAFPTGGLLIRLFIFQHDCGHGSFFPSQKANNVVGFLLGILILTPYGYWRRTHAIHHATSGDLDEREFGDIATITVNEYLRRTPMQRLAYRLYRNPLTLFLIGPLFQFVVKHRLPLDFPRSWKKEWASVLWTDLAIGIVAIAVGETVGWMNLLLVHGPILVITTSAGVWLFYVQHQFEDTYWRRHETWDYHEAAIAGSSYYKLPKVLQWFTGNIGLHHVHHLSSRIPNYRLQQCHDENPELHRVTVLTLRNSLRTARLRLWDEATNRLVGYRELKEARQRPPEAQAA
jgi:acyl-lipid omega-6 desaturase (Delta-12 desaturase)